MHLFKRKRGEERAARQRYVLRDDSSRSGGQNRAFSYYSNRTVSEANVGREPSAAEERLAPQHNHKRPFVHRMAFLLIGLGVSGITLNAVSLDTSPKIVPLSSQSSRVFLRPSSTYQRAATALFRGSLANRTKLTIDVARISASMRHEFPELDAVAITLPVLGHQPVVYIQPSEPSMVLITQNSGSFVLDSEGEALLPAGGIASQLARQNVPVVADQSGLGATIGKMILPSTTVRFIRTVAAQLQAQGIGVSSMTLPKAAGEVDVYISGESFFVKFNTEADTSLQQVGTFVAVFRHLTAEGIGPHQYIDVRVAGRAYYK